MLGSVKKILLLITLIVAANSGAIVDSLFDTPAYAAAGKKAKWSSPTKTRKFSKRAKPKARKKFRSSGRKKRYSTGTKKMSAKAYVRPVTALKTKKFSPVAKIIKKIPPKKASEKTKATKQTPKPADKPIRKRKAIDMEDPEPASLGQTKPK